MLFIMISDSNDRHKATTLYNTYKNIMYHTAYNILEDKELSEDAVHEAMIRIIKNLHKIDKVNSSCTYRFVVIISRNVALNIYNKRKNEVITEDVDEIEFGVDFKTPERLVVDKESVGKISEMISLLPEKLSAVLLLKSNYDCTNKEISGLLGITEDSVRQRLHRAKIVLKKMYGGVLDEK